MKKIVLLASLVLALTSVACSSDKAAKKSDSSSQAAMEQTVAAAPAALIELSEFKDAAVITMESIDGADVLKMSSVVDAGGYGKCGLGSGDLVTAIDGAAIGNGPQAVQALRAACASGKSISITRGGESMTVSAQ